MGFKIRSKVYQLQAYIQFLLQSSNQHGVHSPFVYNLVTECFYDRSKYPEYEALRSYRRELLQNKTTLTITDLGSGSKVFNANTRRVKDIAKTSGTPLKYAKLLVRLMRYFKPTRVLELGTNLGLGTHALAMGNPTATITSIEGCTALWEMTANTLKAKNLNAIRLVNGNFKSEIENLNTTSWDLIFFDGHHSREATLQYFETLLPTAHNDSVFIFDDIYWSKGMASAWETIKNHPQVQVSIDIFKWGLVFFRKEQVKQHFTIRV